MTKIKKYDMIEAYIINNREAHYRLAYAYVKSRESALDIVQESIYKALAASGELKNEAYLKTWFYRIVINTALDYLRKSGRVSYMEDPILELKASLQEDTYKDIDLEQALDKLPYEYKSIITLRYFEDLKLEDIAEVLDLNLNTVKTRLYAGLKKLRIEIELD